MTLSYLTEETLVSSLMNETDPEIINETVRYAALILERLVYPDSKTGFEEIDELDITTFHGEKIKEGLIGLLKRNIHDKSQIIWALSKSHDESLKTFYIEILKESLDKIKEANQLLFQTIIALENIGEKIINKDHKSLLEIQENYEFAKKFVENR